jgi:hypothetical protein
MTGVFMDDLTYYLSGTQQAVEKSRELIERCNETMAVARERVAISIQASIESFIVLQSNGEGEPKLRSTRSEKRGRAATQTLSTREPDRT